MLDVSLAAEGYMASSLSAPQASSHIRSKIGKTGWGANTSDEMLLLYLLGKYESLLRHQWLWRRITSLPQPVLVVHVRVVQNWSALQCSKAKH